MPAAGGLAPCSASDRTDASPDSATPSSTQLPRPRRRLYGHVHARSSTQDVSGKLHISVVVGLRHIRPTPTPSQLPVPRWNTRLATPMPSLGQRLVAKEFGRVFHRGTPSPPLHFPGPFYGRRLHRRPLSTDEQPHTPSILPNHSTHEKGATRPPDFAREGLGSVEELLQELDQALLFGGRQTTGLDPNGNVAFRILVPEGNGLPLA
jgi:hypothetical protein